MWQANPSWLQSDRIRSNFGVRHKFGAGARESTLQQGARPRNFLSVKRALFFHILGEVQADALREAFEEDDPEEHMPVLDETWNGAEFCLQVRGHSIVEVFPEGPVLFCWPFNEEDGALPIDEYGIAVTSSKQTDEIKATVKRLGRNENEELLLRLESRNKILHGRDRRWATAPILEPTHKLEPLM